MAKPFEPKITRTKNFEKKIIDKSTKALLTKDGGFTLLNQKMNISSKIIYSTKNQVIRSHGSLDKM